MSDRASEQSELQTPLTEIEKAELTLVCQKFLTPAGMMLLRRALLTTPAASGEGEPVCVQKLYLPPELVAAMQRLHKLSQASSYEAIYGHARPGEDKAEDDRRTVVKHCGLLLDEMERVECDSVHKDISLRTFIADNARLTTALREAQQRAERLEAALTPSGDTKGEYSGEFKCDVRRTDWDGNEYCESVTVPWTTVKEIMAAIRKRAALQPAAEAIIAAYDGADTIYLHRPECSALRGKSNTFAWDDSAIVQAKENGRSVVPCKCTKVHRAAATAFAAGAEGGVDEKLRILQRNRLDLCGTSSIPSGLPARRASRDRFGMAANRKFPAKSPSVLNAKARSRPDRCNGTPTPGSRRRGLSNWLRN